MPKMKYWNGTSWIIMDANDADTVDGAHAGTGANNVLKLDSSGKVPVANLPLSSPSAAGAISSADKTKLDGIATGANNYTHPTGDGSLHVPATSTTNNGRFLKAGATAGSLSWSTLAKSDVGLGSVLDYGIATQAEAEAGTSDVKYMTPQRTAQAIQKLAPTPSSTSIALADAGNYYTTKTVEGATQEIGQVLNAMRGSLIASANGLLGT